MPTKNQQPEEGIHELSQTLLSVYASTIFELQLFRCFVWEMGVEKVQGFLQLLVPLLSAFVSDSQVGKACLKYVAVVTSGLPPCVI